MAAALQQQQPSFTYNPFNPSCSALPCLQQVVGYTHNDAAEQLASCSSIFGYPVVSTVTLPVDPVYSTDISTSTYISISVSTSVATSTYESISTSTGYIVVAQTDYTTTVVNTIVSTAAASVLPEETFTKRSPSPERRIRRRCKGRPSSSLSSSVVPSSSVSVEACANLQAYASACACLDPEPVTVYASASTSVIPSTTVETIPSTSGTVVTSVLTSVVVQPDFTTITSVIQSYTETTTTTTTTTTASSSTTAAPPPIETLAFVASSSQPGVGGPLVFSGAGGQLSWSVVPAGSGSQFVLENGAMRLQISSIYKFRVGASAASASFGQVWIITDANVASKPTIEWYTPACSVHPTTRELTCATSNGLSVWWLCSSVVYLASPGTTFAQCSQVTIKATT